MCGTLSAGSVERGHLALEQAEARRAAELGRGLEQELKAEADTEQRRPAPTRSAIRRSSPSSRTRSHRTGERADAGQEQAVGLGRELGIAGDRHLGADPLERLLDRAQVAHPVVQQRDPRHPPPQRTAESGQPFTSASPSCDGTPLSLGIDRDRLAQCPREGLEARLDQVVGVGAVAGADVQGELRVRGDGAEELLGQLGVEAGDRDRRQIGLEPAAADGPRCRSRTSPSASSIGTAV